MFKLKDYQRMIESFLGAGYQFELFDGEYNEKRKVYLRHDIDFSPQYAYQMAKIESDMGIRSTYFCLIDSELYNLFDKNIYGILEQIYELGHYICLHIDERNIHNICDVDNILKSFSIALPFSNTKIISRHRPNLKIDFSFFSKGIIDVYNKNFFENIEYASDSRGEWKYGAPTERKAFNEKRSFQLLTHPIWWCINEDSNVKKVDKMLIDRHLYSKNSVNYLNFKGE